MSRTRSQALAAAALLSAGCLITPIAMAHAGSPTQMELTATNQSSALVRPCNACFIQIDPTGAHIGGTEYDAGQLRDRSGLVVGHFAIVSIGVTPFGPTGAGELQLTATIAIGSDQLIAQGLEEPPLDGGTAAITGGTGRFRNAHGQLTYTDQPDGSTLLTIDLN